ncbi:helix-turn-helix transcriptional regulator [Streptococcus suis]|nr:helix-turn-helix transcriptional regulator [Streptococcus suis]MBO4133098.1 helix-turn-helix transcriptional regulator [Streptococcus suis]NQK13380.1 helix-turn-helix transcriptional regulator [Streptococcus suis]HEM3555193.1 helix-turn-helix transcriptional regulator [Streptococcus suis]HEM3557675.1 helix-turn-helix transcriptional regulator [Streptococcus suis]
MVKLKSFSLFTFLQAVAISAVNLIGVTRATLSAWETGKTVPNKKHLQELAQVLSIEPSDLQEEHPHLTLYRQLSKTNKKKVDELTHDLLLEQKVVPLLSVQVLDNVALSAGHGNGLWDEYETKEVFTDKDYLYDVATWIEGQSMEPVYQDGEVALIREGGFDYDGAVYAVAWNEQLYIKKVYLEKDGYRLVSINKEYPDKFAPAEDEPKIVGKIVGNFMPIEQ